jgi:hypothetical protein
MAIGRTTISNWRNSPSTIEHILHGLYCDHELFCAVSSTLSLPYLLPGQCTGTNCAVRSTWQCTGTNCAVRSTWQCTGTNCAVRSTASSLWTALCKSQTKMHICRPQRKRGFYFPHITLSNYVTSIETGDTQKWLCSSLFANNNALARTLTFLHISLSHLHSMNFFNCSFFVWLEKSCTTFLMPATSAFSRVLLQTYLAHSVSQHVFW